MTEGQLRAVITRRICIAVLCPSKECLEPDGFEPGEITPKRVGVLMAELDTLCDKSASWSAAHWRGPNWG